MSVALFLVASVTAGLLCPGRGQKVLNLDCDNCGRPFDVADLGLFVASPDGQASWVCKECLDALVAEFKGGPQ